MKFSFKHLMIIQLPWITIEYITWEIPNFGPSQYSTFETKILKNGQLVAKQKCLFWFVWGQPLLF